MKSWALVVGINTYPALAKQRELNGAVADACDFAAWALDPAGGNVDEERLLFWTHPWPKPETWDKETRKKLQKLETYLSRKDLPLWDNDDTGSAPPNPNRAPKAGEIAKTIEDIGRAERTQALDAGDEEERRVYVFLAGHGIRAKSYLGGGDETCFMAGDFRPVTGSLAAGLLPCDSFRKALLNDRFDEALVFTDCCRSEPSDVSMAARQVSDYAGSPSAPSTLAYAAQDKEPAYETSTDPVRGVFSSVLMHGLRTHRIGPTGDLHADALRQYVRDNVGKFTTTRQSPNILMSPDPPGPLIVSGFPAGAPTPVAGPIVDVSQVQVGQSVVLLDGDFNAVPGLSRFKVTGPTLQLPPLNPALYVVQVSDDPDRYDAFKHPSAKPIRVP